MARYKHYDLKQSKMLPIDFDRQVLPGTFEHTLSYLIDHKIDLSVFEDRYRNDAGGAPAYDPAILLKIILFAYSKGIVHSRKIEALCRENVVCMALSADTAPHFTTIAEFVATLEEEITRIFQESGLLKPMVEGTNDTFKALDLCDDVLKETKLTADAGYSSEANAKYLIENQIDGYVADTNYRKRDSRFKDQEKHKPTRPDEPFAKVKRPPAQFQNSDFRLADDRSHCVCPAGKRLNRNAERVVIGAFEAIKFRGTLTTCAACPLRVKCLRYPKRTPFRQVAFFLGRSKSQPEKYLEKMKRKIDSDHGRYQYSRRLGIVEPVFANLRHTHRLNRFTLRGRKKVNTQWLLYCLVHNIGKVQHYGMATVTTKRKTIRRRRVA